MQMKTITVNGSEVVYYGNSHEKGAAKRDAVLFIHGYPDTHDTWSSQLEVLGEKYRVAAPDMPGAGRSQALTSQSEYHIDRMLKVVDEVATDAFGKDTSFHLVAHDWGALISWVYVSRAYAKRVLTYTAVAGPHPVLARNNLIGKFLSAELDDKIDAIRQVSKSWYLMFFQLPSLPEMLWRAAPLRLWNFMLKSGGVMPYDSMREYNKEDVLDRAIHPINLYRELMQGEQIESPVKITVPCQIVVPRHDFAITPEIYDNHAEVANDLTVQSIASNHWVHRERPDTVNRLIDAFISMNS